MKKLLLLLALFIATTLPMTLPTAHAAPAESQAKWRTFSTKHHHNSTAEVKAIQFLLRARGLYPLQPDGVYGAKTAAAVKKFQRGKGLKVDGIVGPQTWPKLVRVVKRGDRGDFVRAAQMVLREMSGHQNEAVAPDLKVDGIFGRETERATRSAQSLNNWFHERGPQNGVFGTEMWRALTDGFGHP